MDFKLELLVLITILIVLMIRRISVVELILRQVISYHSFIGLLAHSLVITVKSRVKLIGILTKLNRSVDWLSSFWRFDFIALLLCQYATIVLSLTRSSPESLSALFKVLTRLL